MKKLARGFRVREHWHPVAGALRLRSGLATGLGGKVNGLVRQVEGELRKRARPAVAQQTQRFFKPGEKIQARGVRATEVKRIAARARQTLRAKSNLRDVLRFAERLLASPWMEDRAAAIYTAGSFVRRFGAEEFRRSERWLRYVHDWATSDGLSVQVLGPQFLADGKRVGRVFAWARSKNRWYRRAAATSLIPAARRGLCPREVFRVARRLYRDSDDMVQKGVGWLLKEACKARRPEVVRFLLGLKRDAPRLVLRYASEKLPLRERRLVLQ